MSTLRSGLERLKDSAQLITLSRREFLRFLLLGGLFTEVLGFLEIYSVSVAEKRARNIQFFKHCIPVAECNANLARKRILFLTDLHISDENAGFLDPNLCEVFAKQLRSQIDLLQVEPENLVVIWGGDVVGQSGQYVSETSFAAFQQGMNAIHKVIPAGAVQLFTLGNHDFRHSRCTDILQHISNLGIQCVATSAKEGIYWQTATEFLPLHIVVLPDFTVFENFYDLTNWNILEQKLNALNSTFPLVIVTHNLSAVDCAWNGNLLLYLEQSSFAYSLVLGGHTHWGHFGDDTLIQSIASANALGRIQYQSKFKSRTTRTGRASSVHCSPGLGNTNNHTFGGAFPRTAPRHVDVFQFSGPLSTT